MKECPRHDEITQFLKTNPTSAVLTDPFPSQQQLIDHMSNQGNSSSSEEICMMSSDSISFQTRSQSYDKIADKKEDNSSSGKAPSTSSPESSSTLPLTIEKPTLDMVLRPPKSNLRKVFFNPNARAAQFYNVVEDLTQAPCAMSTLEVLHVSAFHTPGSCGRNIQATRCVLGGKSRVEAVTLFLTPPFRLNS